MHIQSSLLIQDLIFILKKGKIAVGGSGVVLGPLKRDATTENIGEEYILLLSQDKPGCV